MLGATVALVLPAVAVARGVREFGWAYYRRVGPVYWMLPTDTVWSYRNGRYEVACIEDSASEAANARFCSPKLIIRCGGRIAVAARPVHGAGQRAGADRAEREVPRVPDPACPERS